MERRDFMKLFGIGSLIVPVIGGTPIREAEAHLIEVPTVKMASTATDEALESILLAREAEVYITLLQNGRAVCISGHTFVMERNLASQPITSKYGIQSSDLVEWQWQLKGRFTRGILYEEAIQGLRDIQSIIPIKKRHDFDDV